MTPQTRHSRTRARLELVGAAALFSTGGAAIKAADFTPVQVAGLRSAIAAITVVLLVRAARRGWSWREPVVGIAYAATLVLFVLANRLTTSANTIFLQSTAPLYLLVLSPFLLREPIRRSDLVFMLAVGTGLALFFVGDESPVATAPDPVRGNLLATLSGVTWAFTIIGLRWLSDHGRGRGRAPASASSDVAAADKGEVAAEGAGVRAVVAGNAIAALACLPWVFPLGTHSATDWAVVAYLGVFQIGVAYMLVTSALGWVPAFEASVLLLVEPALNPIWSWLVHGEVPGVWAMAGGVVILGATLLRTWRDTRREMAVAG